MRLQNVVNAINLLTSVTKQVVISARGVLASFYLSATAGTTITVAGTYYKVAGTTVKNKAENFTHANNKLTYIGSHPVTVKIDCSASFTSDTNNTIIKMCPAVNGVALTNAEIERKLSTGADVGGMTFHWEVELTTDDYIEIFITCNSAGAVITATKLIVLVG